MNGVIPIAAPIIFAAAPFAVGASGTKDPPPSDWGGATPLNQQKWLTPDDYPNAALMRGHRGRVGVSFTIGANGAMIDCKVVRSSGFKDLDEVPCKLLLERAKFRPATDADGNPIQTVGSTSMAFSID